MNTKRRDFLAMAAAAPLAVGATRAMAAKPAKPMVCIFSKHLQFLDYKALAKTCREIGLDGVDLTVRAKGHVLPENVERDLPAAVEAIRAEGLAVPQVTTRLVSGDDPTAVPILKTASKLGVKYFRVGGQKYKPDVPPLRQLEEYAKGLTSLAKLAAKYNMSAGYHNHSGSFQVAGPIWDLQRLVEMVGSPNFGSNFDTGHAAIEGFGGAWKINTRLIAPNVKMMSVKDFVPHEDGGRSWVPLGDGVVPTADMLKIMKGVGFAGPISIHVEYKIASDEAMIEEVRKAALSLRKSIAEAGY